MPGTTAWKPPNLTGYSIGLVVLSVLAAVVSALSGPVDVILVSLVVVASLNVLVQVAPRTAYFPKVRSRHSRKLLEAARVVIDPLLQPAILVDRFGQIVYRNQADIEQFPGEENAHSWKQRWQDTRVTSMALAQGRDAQAWNGTIACASSATGPEAMNVQILPLTNGRGEGEFLIILHGEAEQPTNTEEADESAYRFNFLAHVSHEIRTPLTSVIGLTDVLVEELASSKASMGAISAAATIRRNGAHLLAIVNDILDFSRISSGNLTIEERPLRLQDIVAEVTDTFRPAFERKEVAFEVSLGRFLPAFIHTDPIRLKQVIINLVDNALKFTDEGSVRLSVDHDSHPGSRLTVVVEDTGAGIEAASLEHLFEPFYRGLGSKRCPMGTGLGLTITKRLAEAMGGDIAIESKEGAGTKVTVRIQIGSLDGIPMTMTPARPLRSTSSLSEAIRAVPAGLHVLAAEDSLDNQTLLRHLLQKVDARWQMVENGQEAIDAHHQAAASGHPFDLILLDIEMPVLDGYAAAREIRAVDATTPIVALTAHALSSQMKLCRDAGCNEVVTKPIDRTRFYTILSELMPQRPANSFPAPLEQTSLA